MHILGFFFFIIIIILLLGLSVIGNILRIIFGIGKRKNDTGSRRTQSRPHTHSPNNEETMTGGRRQKKIFEKDEGEYVDFEEIKDEDNP